METRSPRKTNRPNAKPPTPQSQETEETTTGQEGRKPGRNHRKTTETHEIMQHPAGSTGTRTRAKEGIPNVIGKI